MYLAQQSKREPGGDPTAQTGAVTCTGECLGAWLQGERRGLAVFSPGGYHWTPAPGQELLVLKTGQGESPAAVGVRQSATLPAPGEVTIHSQGALRLEGQVQINGVALEELIRSIVAGEVGG